MAKTYIDTGIILKRWNYKERDRMVRVLCATHGKITCRLISAKKLTSKLAGNCEPFMISEFFFAKSKTIDILAGSVPVDTLAQLRTDPYRYACAGFFAELIDRLTEDRDPQDELYQFAIDFFQLLNAEPAHLLMLVSAVFKLCVLLGYQSELEQCVVCHTPIQEEEGNQWNMHVWGIQCPRCVSQEITMPMSVAAIKLLRFLTLQEIEACRSIKLQDQEWQEMSTFMLACVHYLVGAELFSEQVLRGVDWSKYPTILTKRI